MTDDHEAIRQLLYRYCELMDAGDFLYIADRGNDRIVKVNGFSGLGWLSYGSSGSGVGNFDNPTAVLPLVTTP